MPDIPNILEESLLESIIKESPMIANFLTPGSDCGDESNTERNQGRSMPYVEKMMTTSLETELKEKMKRLIFKKKLLVKELQEHKKEIAALREMIINMKLSEDHDFEGGLIRGEGEGVREDLGNDGLEPRTMRDELPHAIGYLQPQNMNETPAKFERGSTTKGLKSPEAQDYMEKAP